MIPDLRALQDAGMISSRDRQFARGIGRIAGETRSEMLAAAALASRQTGEGHTCVAVGQLGDAALWGESVAETQIVLPTASDWLAILESSPLVGGIGGEGSSVSPLVLDSSGRLYLRRYWSFQESLASLLKIGRAHV